MQCEQEYCVYNENSNCLVRDISVNIFGMCESCIIVSLDEELLEKEKKRQRDATAARWEKGGDLYLEGEDIWEEDNVGDE